MKPSDLKKDSRITLRVSSFWRETMAEMGISAQELFDRALDERLGEMKLVTAKPMERELGD